MSKGRFHSIQDFLWTTVLSPVVRTFKMSPFRVSYKLFAVLLPPGFPTSRYFLYRCGSDHPFWIQFKKTEIEVSLLFGYFLKFVPSLLVNNYSSKTEDTPYLMFFHSHLTTFGYASDDVSYILKSEPSNLDPYVSSELVVSLLFYLSSPTT